MKDPLRNTLLSSVNLSKEDVALIARRLCQYPLERSIGREPEPKRSALHDLQCHVSAADAANPLTSLEVRSEKVRRLLELRKEADWDDGPSFVDLPKLEEAQTAHERRLALAADLNNHVEQLKRGAGDPEILETIVAEVRRDDVEPEEAIHRLRALTANSNSQEGVSDAALAEMLKPLIDYFQDEYDEELRHLTQAAAHWVIMGGDSADRRIRRLKKYGFTGLGSLVSINVDRAIFIAVISFVVFFLVFVGYHVLIDTQEKRFGFTAVLSLGLMLSVLLGALVGAMRNLARAPTPLWGVYIPVAALVGAINVGLFYLAAHLNIVALPDDQAPLVIGWVMPAALFLGICLRSRCPIDQNKAARELVRDGAVLGVVMVVSLLVMILLGTFFELTRDHSGPGAGSLLILAFAQGALVGALVLGLVRAAATSCVLIDEPEEKNLQEQNRSGSNGASDFADQPTHA